MKVIDFGKKLNSNTVIALGYFDAIHGGHKVLLNTAVSVAKTLNATATALIFSGGYKKGGEVFTFNERLSRIENTGIDTVFHAVMTKEFLSVSYSDFLNKVFSSSNVKGLICGEDFTFGKNAEGNATVLQKECDKRNVKLTVIEKQTDNLGNKISTTYVKNSLQIGDIKKVNALLYDNYFISGEVVKGKRLGNTIGFPTANIILPKEKTPVKTGVYKTYVIINGKKYPSITNYGAQPTVNGVNNILETYIDGFSGNLYGEILTVYFVDYLRDIKKFNSIEELKNQLTEDKRSLYD